MSNEAASEVLPTISVWRLGLFGTGVLTLLVQVILIRDFPSGITATVIGALAIGAGIWHADGWVLRRSGVHAISALLVLLSLTGLCASSCGSYEAYNKILFLPTALMGFSLHALTAILLWWEDRDGEEHIWGDLAIATCIGGSAFYASILLVAGSWCGTCFAVHALMAVQFASLLHRRQGLVRILGVTAVVAAVGVVNLAYHHRMVPETRNDAAELVAYLRSARTQTVPLVDVQQRAMERKKLEERLDQRSCEELQKSERVLANSAKIAENSTPLDSAGTPTVEAPAGPPAPSHPNGAVERRPDQANRWGDDSAPVVALTLLNTGCPACRVIFPQVLELADLVKNRKLQMRFLLTYKPELEATQATATLSLAAGIRGEQTLLETLNQFYIKQNSIELPAEALAALPSTFPRAEAVDTLRRHRSDITALLKDAVLLQQRLGAQVEPITWLYRQGDPLDRPRRRLEGVQMSAVLRAAVLSVGVEQ